MPLITDELNKQFLSRAQLATTVNSMRARLAGSLRRNVASTLFNSTVDYTAIQLTTAGATSFNFSATEDDIVQVNFSVNISAQNIGGETYIRPYLNGATLGTPYSGANAAPIGSVSGLISQISGTEHFTPINGTNTFTLRMRTSGNSYYTFVNVDILLFRRQ